MKNFTVLIARMRPPNFQDIEAKKIKNIAAKLAEKCTIRLVWVAFQTEKVLEYKTSYSEVIDFRNYRDAVEILDKVKPDVVLIAGMLEFMNLSFKKAGTFRRIPVVAYFFWYRHLKGSVGSWFKLKIRLGLALSSTSIVESHTKHRHKKFKVLGFILKRFLFFVRTYVRFWEF